MNPHPTVNLQPGSSGEDVTKLQKYLMSNGFDIPLLSSGKTQYGTYGEQTKAAVAAFQKAKGITTNGNEGYYGPNTIGYINSSLGGGTTDTTQTSGGKSPLDLATTLGSTPTTPTSGVGSSESARMAEIQRIKDEQNAGLTAPTPYKTLDEFTKLRQEQGIVDDENELNSIRNESALIKEELRKFSATAGEGTSEAGRIGVVSEAERNANFRAEGLALREQNVLDRLNTKNSYINTVIGLGKEDYQTALNNYNTEYNKNIKAIDTYNANLDAQKKDALTAFTTVSNLLKDANMTSLDPSVSSQLDTLALKAGLPKGVFQSVIAATPNEKILAPVMVDTPTGKDMYFYTQDKNGVPSLKTVQHLPGTGSGGVGGVTLNATDKQKLLSVNFTTSEVAQIQSDVATYGIDKVLEGATNEKQKNAIREVYGGTTEKKVTRAQLESSITNKQAADALKEAYTDKELKAFADKAGKSSVWTGAAKDIARWLETPDAKTTYIDLLMQQYKAAGMAE